MSLVRLEKMAAIAREHSSSRVLTHNELHVVVIFEARQAAHFESKIIVGVNGNRDSPLESTFWQALLVQSCRRCGKICRHTAAKGSISSCFVAYSATVKVHRSYCAKSFPRPSRTWTMLSFTGHECRAN
jgi:hypothetical protein